MLAIILSNSAEVFTSSELWIVLMDEPVVPLSSPLLSPIPIFLQISYGLRSLMSAANVLAYVYDMAVSQEISSRTNFRITSIAGSHHLLHALEGRFQDIPYFRIHK